MAGEVRLRECVVGDAAELALVGAATFLEAFAGRLPVEAILTHTTRNHSVAYYERALADPAASAWLAEAEPGGAPVGYGLVTVPDFAAELVKAGDLELRRIYLFSRFHAGGTGQRLMDVAVARAVASGAGRLLLGVHRENERALGFYARNGFREIGTRRFQLGASVFDDLVLGKVLG